MSDESDGGGTGGWDDVTDKQFVATLLIVALAFLLGMAVWWLKSVIS